MNDIPEHYKRKANEEAKSATEVGDEGVKGVDEVFPEDSGAQRGVREDDPKGVEVPQVCSNNPVLVVGAREETSGASLNKSLIHSCKFEIVLFKLIKLVSRRTVFVSYIWILDV